MHQNRLPLWDGAIAQPRDNRGRFAKVSHSTERKLILVTAQLMRSQLGLEPDERLVAR